jgi:general secretion pathway protein J
VLIATALLAVMMTLLMGSLRIGAGAWTQGERKAEAATRLLVADNFFRAYLSAALPLSEAPQPQQPLAPLQNPAGRGSGLVFRGGPTYLEFAGVLPPQVRGGLYKFRLFLDADQERSDLKLAIRPFAGNPEAGGDAIEDVLILENVELLRFAYFRRAPAEGEQQWIEEWQEAYLPALVRVEITLRGEPPWPPLLIAPRMEMRR